MPFDDRDAEPTTSDARNVPLRERFAADHDEPWQYQPYHLSDREKLGLLRRREEMQRGEFWN